MRDLYVFVIPKIKEHWRAVAYALQFSIVTVQKIEATCHGRSVQCCQQLFRLWLLTDKDGEPKTWLTLLAKLEQVEPLKPVVDELKKVIL